MRTPKYHGIIVVPCYNEESRLPFDLWSEIVSNNSEWLWYFVDDGSQDHTAKILERLTLLDNVKILALEVNVGKAEAVRKGMLEAIIEIPTISWVGYIDSDGAFSLKDVSRILNLSTMRGFNSFNAILGSRVKLGGRNINRTIVRHILGRILASLIGVFWKGNPYDMQSGFKLFSNTDQFEQSIEKPFHSKWFIDLEIFIRISNGNFQEIKYWEEPLMFWQEVGNSKLNSFQILRAIQDFLVLAIFYRRSG